MTNLVAVIRGDRHLSDAVASFQQLNNNLSIKMKHVGVLQKWQMLKRVHTIGSVTRVVLREPFAQEEILEATEDLITNIFVKRHAPPTSTTLEYHTRTKNSV